MELFLGRQTGMSVLLDSTCRSPREKGNAAERTAAEYLKRKGWRILETNYHTRRGEIDIIARDRNDIVFCEVKYRKGANPPSLELITTEKQKKIVKAAYSYIRANASKWTWKTTCSARHR